MSEAGIKKRGTAPKNAETVLGDPVELAQWYWVSDDESEWFGCVTHIGSNYVEVTSTQGGSARIHADVFFEECRLEPNPAQVIDRKTTTHREEVRSLMREVEALTARLGVGYTAASLSSGAEGEGQALARLDPNHDVGQYKTDLVKAKKEDLPALFKKIEAANEGLAQWMRAETLPMRAQFTQMKTVIGRIDDRIFNVELYAGLTEVVEQITDGEPAEMTEKIRLMQRRCYMDEECLAQYKTGGMSFKELGDFDAWLTQPENRDRLLPFPRCVVAFRVRRKRKHREITSFIDFFYAVEEAKADELTFLYIRNGERTYRMNTALEFGEEMFPDTEHHQLTSGQKLWAEIFAGSVKKLITDAQYQGLVEEYEAEKAADKIKAAEHKVALKAWKVAKKAAKLAGEKFEEREPWYHSYYCRDPASEYEPFEPDNIYYDDIQKQLADEVQKYNRIGIILQGLLDRSPVLHPHPPWKIWSEGGFAQALELIYDASRALVGGPKPDFAAYHREVNSTLKTGCVTVGQREAWFDDEDDGEERRARRGKNPGPDELSRVAKYEPRKRRCVYAWNRDGQSYENYGKEFRATGTVDADEVFNVDGYKPGDFRQFFQDPRTRAEYLQWAPWMLEAEEYHAGNRTVEEPPKAKKRVSTAEGRAAYRRRKEREALLEKMVKLRRTITTQGGDKWPEGSVWKVAYSSREGLTVEAEIDGKNERIRCLQPWDLVLVGSQPTAS